ncbi:MAG: nucleotidyltransferase domain-containing protein [Acidobacteria bacterium]|nr:nucleotidyltransferase domain-containing protein [Acidobacteriota bacterium]MYC81444.1 nucleotidyltransferase domain-containing protein [Acidobacteriota bacterium]
MNVAASETLISIMVDRIVRGFRPSQVVLFGSHARGAATEWSDVDLLVILPNGTDKRDSAIEIRRILVDLPVCKDIVVATPEEVARRGHMVGTLLRSALRDGRVLYERP